MSEHMQLSLALCRIGLYTCFRALCCKGPPPPRPEYDVVCIGLTGAGKTSLLSRLCSEGSDGIVPTTGFSIKAVPFPNAVLNVKELGGADNIKKYWSRYYQGSQGVVFVLDSASSDEDLEAARNELHSALQHPQLCTLPFLILANHQDKPAARTPNQVKKYFELEPLARGKRWILEGSTTDNLEAVKESFGSLHLSVFLLLALLPFGHAKAALPQHGHPGAGKRPGPQRSSPPGRKKRERETGRPLPLFHSSSISVCTVDFILLKKTQSTFSSHTEPLPALPV